MIAVADDGAKLQVGLLELVLPILIRVRGCWSLDVGAWCFRIASRLLKFPHKTNVCKSEPSET